MGARAEHFVDPVREGLVREPALGEAVTQPTESQLPLGVRRPDIWSGHIWIIGAKPASDKAGNERPRSWSVTAHAPIACAPPSTCTISPVVAGNQSDSSATHPRAAGSALLRSQPSGARLDQTPSN